MVTRKYRYVMELSGMGSMMGPKSTNVHITQRIVRKEPGRAFVVEHSSHTPNVPSGDCFRVVNRYGLFAVDERRTRLIITGAVNFTKSTMFKCTPR